MLSNFLKSSYLQYKDDTNTVASWLAKTAKACGYAVDVLVEDKQQKQHPTGRLKGKGRKQAREAATKNDGSSAALSNRAPVYAIALKDFTSLAEWSAGHAIYKYPSGGLSCR